MSMMNLSSELTFLVGLVVFWGFLYFVAKMFNLKKNGLEVKPGYLIYKSKKLNSSLDKLARNHPRVWIVLSYIGLVIALGLMVFSVYFLISNILMFTMVGEVSYIAPVIPGLTLSLDWLPFFIFAAIIVILPHELAHGVVARLENIPVLSTGLIAFLVFFGAFVEPDEEEFEKAPISAKLRLLSAGSSTNLVTALLALLLLMGLFLPPAGILINETMPGGPLDSAGIGRWDVIQSINGTQIVNYESFHNYIRHVKTGENLELMVLHNNEVQNITITTVGAEDNSSRAIVGLLESGFLISYQPTKLGLGQYTNTSLYWTTFWIYLIATSVAIFNMVPLYPFDGERMLYYPLERFVKKRKRELRIGISLCSATLLALNFIVSFWRYGLLSI